MELTKVIITILKDKYQYIQELEHGNTDYATTRMLYHYIKKGTPLDSVKAEIEKKCDRINSIASVLSYPRHREIQELLCEILDTFDEYIGKADMSGKSCSTCKNNDDEFSGECYECLKGIFDHYEAESEDKE